MSNPIFLKLGGSLLTDKTGVETLRSDVLARLAGEIAQAWHDARHLAGIPLSLVLGHGSGSFGHVAAARHSTRAAVRSTAQWHGFAEVSDAAARLNRAVAGALLAAGLPAVTLQPSASAVCEDGRLVKMAAGPVIAALQAGLLPVVYGDVAFDRVRGGTIISTEEILAFLCNTLRPGWLLLAGETPGVLDQDGQVVAHITAESLPELATSLGGSRGTDVTGGMATKVRQMLELTAAYPGLRVRVFSGLEPGLLVRLLQQPETNTGTELT
jgi:isopentenyl phosphate kinase